MLETEEVDVDYFTPSTSTTLSKIFGNTTKEEDLTENSSLKYNPPLPPQIATKPEEPKQTQYFFAGTVFAYEWVDNSYLFKGRLGFAVLKILSSGVHKMVIYDSNKTTLSALTIAQNTEIKVNENIGISYYDNLQKFWIVNPSTSNLNEILDILKTLNVNLQREVSGDSECLTQKAEFIIDDVIPTTKLNVDEKESDTEASLNRKTKNSILKRMATMGQSVLPATHITVSQSSDSSDSNKSHSQQKQRHKLKSTYKKNSTEKKTLELEKITDLNYNKKYIKPEKLHVTHKDSLNEIDQQQIVPTGTTNIITLPSNNVSDSSSNVGLFITEQKVCHSELRINMNRMTDKLDSLLDKVTTLENVNSNNFSNRSNDSQFTNEIIQKLLKEYERKILIYENFITQKGFDCDTLELSPKSKDTNKCELLSKECNIKAPKNLGESRSLEELCNVKDKKINQLQNELQHLSDKAIQLQNHEENLLKELNELKMCRDNVSTKLVDAVSSDQQGNEIPNKLKQIMNNTYQAISLNFNDEEKYTGSKIKSIVGLVVKKTTIESLKES